MQSVTRVTQGWAHLRNVGWKVWGLAGGEIWRLWECEIDGWRCTRCWCASWERISHAWISIFRKWSSGKPPPKKELKFVVLIVKWKRPGKFIKRVSLKAQQSLGIICSEWVILAAAGRKFLCGVAIWSANMSKQSGSMDGCFNGFQFMRECSEEHHKQGNQTRQCTFQTFCWHMYTAGRTLLKRINISYRES